MLFRLPRRPKAASDISWVRESMGKPQGRAWMLRRGTRSEKVRPSLFLGVITEDEATRCHDAINWLRTYGTATGRLPTPDAAVVGRARGRGNRRNVVGRVAEPMGTKPG